ncbi:hypothetical protein ACPUER_34105 [Burkholderia sp. DN3021]|uniref:hypothetical protein n=1 Tax=Burkholderia sp. DN3021 TaxID=3410137 RepID=UPI003C7C469C
MLAFIQFTRMGQPVRAGQRDADSSSTVQRSFDRTGSIPVPAGLDRTPVGRIIRKPFVAPSGSRHAVWLQCRPFFARLKGAFLAALHFAVVNVLAHFRFRKRVPVPALVSGGVSKIAGRKCMFVIPVHLIRVFS